MKRLRTIGSAALAAGSLAAILFGATGCATASAVADDAYVPVAEAGDLLNSTQTQAAWDADIKAFPYEIAPGYAWPRNVPDGFTGKGMATEEGFTSILVAQYWACTWENTLLTAEEATDEVASDAALAQIDNYLGLDIVKTNFPDADVWYSVFIEPLKTGDIDALRSDASGCGAEKESTK